MSEPIDLIAFGFGLGVGIGYWWGKWRVARLQLAIIKRLAKLERERDAIRIELEQLKS